MNSILIRLGENLFLLLMAFDKNMRIATYFFNGGRVEAVCFRLNSHHDDIAVSIGNSSSDPQMIANLNWSSEINVGDILDLHIFVACKFRGCNPPCFYHLSH